MIFERDSIYEDKLGNKYKFVRRGGVSVAIFEKLGTQKLTCRHESGKYRWDDILTGKDIIGVSRWITTQE